MELSNFGFDEALSRLIQTDPQEVEEAIEAAKLKEEEVSRYVEERRDSIARGARRSRARFRL